ncbi:MAG: hypothetical protein QE283_05640 [Rhodoferax sp.]|nr:hypothetical protein [Rhodoferax sp.]
MKLKLIALATFAVCGSSAFAACTTPSTNSDQLVMECAPFSTVHIAGASAQAPALHNLLLSTSAVFDLTKAIAIVTPHTGSTATKYYASKTSSSLSSSTVTTSVASSSNSGAKNTVIYLGFGATGTTNAGKRVAVVYNTSNGSFAGVKMMTEGATVGTVTGTGMGTLNPSTGLTNGDELSQGLLTTAQAAANTTLTCVKTGTTSSSTAAAWSYNSGSPIIPSYACTGNSFNYLTTAPAGGSAGVQLALADVAPKQASLGVLTAGKWTASKFPMTVTGMQGFGIMVNNKALQALISREVTAGRLSSSCVAANIYGSNEAVTAAITAGNSSATLLTAACQPSIRTSDMNALVRGTATAELISGSSSDTTTISYYRRVPFSGTQAASNILFAGQAATEGFSTATLAAAATGYTAPIGTSTTGSPAATIDSSGNYSYTSTSGKYKNYAKVSGSNVISGVSGDSTTYAFGVVSLEKVWTAVSTGSSGVSGLTGGSWVKLDGISPNYDMSTGTHDTKQRTGMQAGYPFQFEMVAIKNAANGGSRTAVVDAIVTGLATDTYNLPGIAYIGSTNSTYKAKFYRGGSANNYAPLTSYDTTAY